MIAQPISPNLSCVRSDQSSCKRLGFCKVCIYRIKSALPTVIAESEKYEDGTSKNREIRNLVNVSRKSELELDTIDKRLIALLQKDCRTPLDRLAKALGTSKSTVHYRIRRLEKEGVIEGYYAHISPAKLKKEYASVVFTRAKPGMDLQQRIKTGRAIASIPGVWCVYSVFGEYDFIFLVRADSREDLSEKVHFVQTMKSIERTDSQIVDFLIKEDPRLESAELGLASWPRNHPKKYAM